MSPRGLSKTRRAMEEYFDLLEEPLPRRAVRAVLEEGKEPAEVMRDMSYWEVVEDAGPTLLRSMPYFWHYKDTGRAVADELRALTRTRKALVAYYSGAIKPVEGPRFVRRTLLYADVVVMKDPVSGTALVRHGYSPKVTARLAVWKALEVLRLRDLCLGAGGRGPPPLVVLPPPAMLMDEEEFEAIVRLSDEHTLEASSEIFGQGFGSLEELSEFVKSARGPDELAGRARRTELLELPDKGLDAGAWLRKQMEDVLKSAPKGAYRGPDDPELLKEAYLTVVSGRFGAVNYQLWSCGRLGAQPSTDLEYHWRRLLWVYEHDQARLRPFLGFEAKVLRLIHRPEFRWLGKVPVKTLVKMREEGELEGLRAELAEILSTVSFIPPDQLSQVAPVCAKRLERALDEHERELKEITGRLRLSLAKVALWGTISMATPFYPPIAALMPVLYLILGRPCLKDVYELASLVRRWRDIKRRPIGILLKPWRAHKAREKGLR